MAKKISELAEETTPANTSDFEIAQSGSSFRVTWGTIKSLIRSVVTAADVGLGSVLNKAQLAKDGSEPLTGSLDANGNPINNAPFDISNIGTGNYTFAASDAGKLITGNDSSAQTFTVLDNTFVVGTTITIVQLGTGQITISAGTGQTINNRQGHTKTAGQYATIAITQYSADVWMLTGDTA